ncbi:MAG: hypothetical protein KAI24_26280 [Planctomycetes bacterium]|nr:hypothetical protein [Planctomycetota bacterium]
MSHLTILSLSQVSSLRQRVDAEMATYTTADSFPLPEASTMLSTPIDAATPPDLVVDQDRRTAHDAENAIAVFRWLPDLDLTQAADPRLWTTLGLREFWRYMGQRWPAAKASTITSRYFVTGGRQALNRHGIARLWWGAKLTYAPWERDESLEIFKGEDPGRFTRVFFAQQMYAVDLMERNLGSSLMLRTCVLAALEEFGPKVSQRDDLSQLVGKGLNQVLQTRQLESRPVAEVRETVRSLVADIAGTLRPAAV